MIADFASYRNTKFASNRNQNSPQNEKKSLQIADFKSREKFASYCNKNLLQIENFDSNSKIRFKSHKNCFISQYKFASDRNIRIIIRNMSKICKYLLKCHFFSSIKSRMVYPRHLQKRKQNRLCEIVNIYYSDWHHFTSF